MHAIDNEMVMLPFFGYYSWKCDDTCPFLTNSLEISPLKLVKRPLKMKNSKVSRQIYQKIPNFEAICNALQRKVSSSIATFPKGLH